MAFRVFIDLQTAAATKVVSVADGIAVELWGPHIDDATHGALLGSATTDANGGCLIDITVPQEYCVKAGGVFVEHRHNMGLTPGPGAIVIAAQDSSARDKAFADFVCDGAADEADFQDALALLTNASGRIIVCPGEYTFGGSFIVDLLGSSPGSDGFGMEMYGAIIKPAAGVTAFKIRNARAWYRPWAFRGLHIDGADLANTVGVQISGDTTDTCMGLLFENGCIQRCAKGATFDLAGKATVQVLESNTFRQFSFVKNGIGIELPANATRNSVMQLGLDRVNIIVDTGQTGISIGNNAEILRSRWNVNIWFTGTGGSTGVLLDSRAWGAVLEINIEDQATGDNNGIVFGTNYEDGSGADNWGPASVIATFVGNFGAGGASYTNAFGKYVGSLGHTVQTVRRVESPEIDLSAGADLLISSSLLYFSRRADIVGAYILYTETSSADAGVGLRIGQITSPGVFDTDYFYSADSEASKSIGYARNITGDLLATIIGKENSLTFGCSGAKVGAGKVKFVLDIAER